MKHTIVTATQFKANCLAIFHEIERGGSTYTITRRGQPIAVVNPAPQKAFPSPANSWAGKVEIIGDIVGDMPELWEVTRT
jgi:antitoxin (DNA-binding transcriptional repressor) of toxin-antitoxin stability system